MMKKVYLERKAANKIVAFRRGVVQKRKYKSIRCSLIKVQTFFRRLIAVNYVRKVRDPYIDMTYKEMKKLLAKEKSRLEDAISSKDFKGAAELEALM